MNNEIATKAIAAVINGLASYCKFLSANDSGETGGHQSGILISKSAKDMLWQDEEMRNHHILKKYGRIRWQDDYVTDCTFTWYESKNELRVTGFGRGKSPLAPEFTGALFVMVKDSEADFQGYLLNTDDDITQFLDAFALTPAETNRPIELGLLRPEYREKQAIESFIKTLRIDFPTSAEMSKAARIIQNQLYANQILAITNPDSILLRWTEQEYALFQALEQARYGSVVARGFVSVHDFIGLANHVLNRRKSRAGKSLEHHLSAIFDENKIQYTPQALTEGRKRPDFLFPSEQAYHDMTFKVENLCTLAAKTTCKDRWRQILNEADRLRDENKYLFTMQQGISAAQMDEMNAEKVVLVVPTTYHTAYPKEKRNHLWSLSKFVSYIRKMEGID